LSFGTTLKKPFTLTILITNRTSFSSTKT